jgi:ATP-dependent RNA circularization protein (DNA/RNA ligase family)
MDGSSMTVYCDGRDYGVCSRKIDMVETDANTFWKVAKSERLLDGLRYLCDKTQQSLAFQGELCGPGIQGNRHKLTEPGFYLYDIWSITRQEYLTINEKYDLLYALDYQKDGISVKHVGVVGFVNLSGMTMNDLLEDADKENGNIEGYVYKKAANPRLSFKVISNKYLLKHGE